MSDQPTPDPVPTVHPRRVSLDDLGRPTWAVWCPFCHAEHRHGPVIGERSSHCRGGGTYLMLAPVEPTRVLSFHGTRAAFLDYLDSWHGEVAMDRRTGYGETYEWEITASIARHPAGKGLGRGN